MKRKQLFQVGLLLMAVLLLSTSCVHQTFGLSGDIVTEYRPLKGFEKIEISGSPNVYYTQADSFSVKVKGSKDGLENILTDVNEGTLSIRNRGKMGIVRRRSMSHRLIWSVSVSAARATSLLRSA